MDLILPYTDILFGNDMEAAEYGEVSKLFKQSFYINGKSFLNVSYGVVTRQSDMLLEKGQATACSSCSCSCVVTSNGPGRAS
jgi:hypothetical protein